MNFNRRDWVRGLFGAYSGPRGLRPSWSGQQATTQQQTCERNEMLICQTARLHQLSTHSSDPPFFAQIAFTSEESQNVAAYDPLPRSLISVVS